MAGKRKANTRRCIALAASLGSFASLHAQSTSWTWTGATGTWSATTNWNNGVPSASLDAFFNRNAAYLVHLSSDAAAHDLHLSNGLVTLDLAGHTLAAAGRLIISDTPFQSASLTISGGTLTVNGSAMSVVGNTPLPGTVSYSGQMAINSGTVILANDLLIGRFANGILSASGGAYLTSNNGLVATDTGDTGPGSGTVLLTGAGTQWTVSNNFTVGGNPLGGATMDINSGAALNVANLLTLHPSDGLHFGINGGMVTAGTLDSSENVDWLNSWVSGTIDINNSNLTIGTISAGTAGPLGTSLTLSAGRNLRVSGMNSTLTVPASGTLNVTGGSLYSRSLDLSNAGTFTFTSGTITVDGGQFLPEKVSFGVYLYGNSFLQNVVNSVEVNGSSSTASVLSLVNGGTVSVSLNDLFVGHSGKRGVVTIDGASSELVMSNGAMYVGLSASTASVVSNGTLQVTNGGQAIVPQLYVGSEGGIGSAIVDGPNSTVQTSLGNLEVGWGAYSPDSGSLIAGLGTLQLTNGAHAISQNSTFVGYGGAKGWLLIDGSNSSLATEYIDVGMFNDWVGTDTLRGQGTLQITNGAQVSSVSDTSIGDFGRGTVSVNGAGFTVGRTLKIGLDSDNAPSGTLVGAGTLSVSGAGSVTSNAAVIGEVGGIGAATLNGSGTTWANTTSLYIGNDGSGNSSVNGTGTLTLSSNAALTNGGLLTVYSGGKLIVNSGASILTHDLDLSSAGSFNFTGGTVTVSGGQFVPKLTTFTVFGDPNGTSYTHSIELNGSSSAAATLNLSGGATLSSTATQTFIGHSGLWGALNVDGSGTHWDLPGGLLAIGTGRNSGDTLSGQGTLDITNGGWVSNSANTLIGWHGGNGTVTITGPGSKLDSTNALLGIGESGFDNNGTNFDRSHGTLLLSNGAEASSHTITRIGDQAGIGYVSLNNATLNVGQTLYVGIGQNGAMTLVPGIGTLLVSNGGDVNSAGGAIGSAAGVGTVNLSGTGTTWTNTTDLNIGNDSTGSAAGTGTVLLSSNAALSNTGTLRVYSGGTLSIASGASLSTATLNLTAGSFGFSDGTVSAGTLITTGNLAKFNWTGGTLDITNSSLTIGTVSAATAGPVGTFLTLASGRNLRVSKVGSTLTVPASGSLNVTGGSVYARSLNLANASTFTFTGGTITVDGGAFTPKLGTVIVFESPTATNYTNSFDVNGSAGMVPLLSFVGGASVSTAASNFFVGHSGNSGMVVVDGNNSVLGLSTGEARVGDGRDTTGTSAAQGTLNISNGGRATMLNASFVGLQGGKGWIGVDGSNSMLSGNQFDFGTGAFTDGVNTYFGEGTLTVTRGGQVTFSSPLIGDNGRGWVSVSDVNSEITFQNSGIGEDGYGEGTLLISNNAQVNVTSLGLDIGAFGGQGMVSVTNGGQLVYTTTESTNIGRSGGMGTVSLDGQGSTWNAETGNIYVGNDSRGLPQFGGAGTIAISNGASLIGGGLLKVWSGGHVIFSGGTLSTTSIDTEADPSRLNWTGGTLKLGGGIVNIGAISVPGGGTLMGTGNIPNSVAVASNGHVAPGNGAGALQASSVTFSPQSDLDIELGGHVAGTSYDQLQVTGNAALDGILRVTLLSSFMPIPGDQFDVLTFGSSSGDISIDNETGLKGLVLSKVYSSNKLTLVASAEYGGDANLDGQVDMSDVYALSQHWLQNGNWLGGDFDGNGVVNAHDLGILALNWQVGVGGASFGEALTSFGSLELNVPEPAMFVYTGLCLAAAASRRVRGRVRTRDAWRRGCEDGV